MAVYCIYMGVRDDKGLSATLEFCIPDTYTIAQASSYASALAVAVDDLIGGQIEKLGIRYGLDLPVALKSAPAANSDVEEGATFTWNVDGGFVSSNRLPTFLETFLQTGSSLVDLTDATVQAFTDLILTGDLTVLGAVDYRGTNIDSVKTARETFQKTRRSRTL